MAYLLDQINDDDPEAISYITFTDTGGVTAEYEFLDIVSFAEKEYAVVCTKESDGFVDIFEIEPTNGGEKYIRVTDDAVLDEVFRIFMMKNEDEFDFDI